MRLKLAKVSHFASLTFLSWSMQNWPSLFGSMDFHSLRVELVAQWLNKTLSETSASVYESQVNISTIQIWIRLYSCIHWCYLQICVQACFISQHALDSCLDFFLNSHRCYYLVCGVNRQPKPFAVVSSLENWRAATSNRRGSNYKQAHHPPRSVWVN